MKLISSQHSHPATRVSLATCAFVLGAAFASAQATYPSRDSSATQSGTRNSSANSSSSSASPSTTTSSDTATAPDKSTWSDSKTSSATTTPAASSADANAAGAMTGRDATVSAGKLGFMDRRFVNKAADAGMSEVAIAQLASERATNADVKSFAQQLVQDHTAVNSELTGIASQKSVKLDKEDGKDRFYKRLSNKSGAEFDQEFVAHMVDEHEDAVKLFEKTSQDAKDTDLRSFAAKHVDHLRLHLQKAQSLRASLVPTGRDSTMSGRADSSISATTPSEQPVSTPATASTEAHPSPSSNTNTDKASGSDRSGTYATPGPSSSSTDTSSSTTPKRDK